MANISDAFGTITVEKVGKEFLQFLKTVQGSDEDAYYKLCEVRDFQDVKPDADGDVEFEFSTFGRWNYGTNLEGYLDGEWMNQDDKCKKAYEKFIKALSAKDGVVVVEYTDCDPAMDWMGQGVAQLEMNDGVATYSENFEEDRLDVVKYADMTGIAISEAFETLHGEEPAQKYEEYVEQCKKEGKKPKNPQKWYDQDFEWEE